MKIIITPKLGEPKEYIVNKEIAIIGRRSNCDVCVPSEYVSREHLEVEVVKEAILIRDITSSNWVSYNNEKLSKTEQTKYFDFSPLVLPGDFIVNIEAGRSFEVDSDAIAEHQTSTKNMIKKARENRKKTKPIKVGKATGEPRRGRRGKPKFEPVDKKKEEKRKTILMVMGVITLIALIYLLTLE